MLGILRVCTHTHTFGKMFGSHFKAQKGPPKPKPEMLFVLLRLWIVVV